ncbi:MAG: hypothetical protein DI582_06040 [Azospirillum brasilense]|nr:MAG: hypothetical protein DI582_06040 [Azospirillum brasilense]
MNRCHAPPLCAIASAMTSKEPARAAADALNLPAMVRQRDYRRFLAIQLAAPEQRAGLYALTAFATEMLHIPQHVKEPLAGFMRFAWWREALQEMVAGKPARAHPMLQALAPLMVQAPALHAQVLDALITVGQQSIESNDAQAARHDAEPLLNAGWAMLLGTREHAALQVLSTIKLNERSRLRVVLGVIRFGLTH